MNAGPLSDDPAPNRTAVTRVVGLGASAGGLEALQQFIANVPAASGLAYVVVQHLDPTHKAMLTELLQRATAMPVHEATESMRAEPDMVYVIPASTELTIVDGRLHLAEPAQPRGRRLPIDVLFCSLARDQGERAIGVVLSGMGSDGTIGLQAMVKQRFPSGLYFLGRRLNLHPLLERADAGGGINALSGDFDLRLTFDRSPRGAATYYGWSAEGRGKLEDLDQELGKLLKE